MPTSARYTQEKRNVHHAPSLGRPVLDRSAFIIRPMPTAICVSPEEGDSYSIKRTPAPGADPFFK